MNKIRLQKYFSECGIMSRRAAEAAIADGRVTVNGEPAVIGQSVDPDADAVLLDGEPVRRDPEKKPVYYMLHKPRGYITSLSDEKGRKCVTELLKDVSERVYPVGRLDYNSEGLLLLTNDGELTNKLTHPSHGVKKTYVVVADSVVSDEQIVRLGEPVVSDGERLQADSVELISLGDKRSVLRIVLSEGKNREIRRIFEENGVTVRRLKRVAVGRLELGDLKKGEVRPLEKDEIAYLKRLK